MFFKSDEKEEPVTIKREKSTLKKYNKSDLIYNNNHSFHKYFRDIKKFDKLSFKLKYYFLVNIFNDLDKLDELKTQKETTEKK